MNQKGDIIMGLIEKMQAAGMFSPILIATYVIGAIYLAAWYANGANGAHFSCADLLTFYATFVAGRLATHGIDSVCNSPKGEPPTNPKG